LQIPVNSLVTGGLHGIGRAIVQALLDRGDRVFVFDHISAQDKAVTDLLELGCGYFQVDVSSFESIKDGFSKLLKELELSENKNLGLLVNNAGISRDAIAIRMSEQDWDAVINVNLKGTFFCSQFALKNMIKVSRGYIINISSIVGIHGNSGQANYAASKAGIIALTKSLAQEYASRNIMINAIAPGFIQTKMTDNLPDQVKKAAFDRIALKRFGQPGDVAELVNFLTSGKADYITGQVIELTGGMF
jgi:3-oxoacyl-[acyl-carrier protein] reductase